MRTRKDILRELNCLLDSYERNKRAIESHYSDTVFHAGVVWVSHDRILAEYHALIDEISEIIDLPYNICDIFNCKMLLWEIREYTLFLD